LIVGFSSSTLNRSSGDWPALNRPRGSLICSRTWLGPPAFPPTKITPFG
jgi:hypothetical protein